MTDFSKMKVRCHAIGQIMSESTRKSPMQCYLDAIAELAAEEAKYEAMPKKDGKLAQNKQEKIMKVKAQVAELEKVKNDDPLSEGCKTYLTKLYGYEKYRKWSANKDKGNKFTIKGKLVEDDSIDLLCRLDKKMLRKNELRIENDYLNGIPDLFEGENVYESVHVIDVKSSWDIETFLENLGKPLNKAYWWQIQGYMALSGAMHGEISYCLVNTPDSILNDEKYRLFRAMNPLTEEDPAYKVAAAILENNLTFDDMPMSDRRIKFYVDRDEEAIQKVYSRVQKCREWMPEIEKMHNSWQFDKEGLPLI